MLNKYICKRFSIFFVCLCVVLLCVSACGNIDSADNTYEREIESIIESDQNLTDATEVSDNDITDVSDALSNTEDTSVSEPIDDETSEINETNEEEENRDIDESSQTGSYEALKAYSEEELASADKINTGRFAYSSLSDIDRRVYNQMFLGLNEMTDGALIDASSQDVINRLFQCVMMDHPEIFWVTGYTYVRYTAGDELKAVGFTGSYTMTNAVRESRQVAIDEYVNRVLGGMPAGDDYAKIKYAYEYIVLNTEYVIDSPDNQNICSVCINGRSVCQGYAKTLQYILNKAGVMCTMVPGSTYTPTSGTQSHTWNLVKSNGEYYYVDATWGDASYLIPDDYSGNVPQINYNYLCVPFNEITKTHTIASPVAMPPCNSMADNYYVREGCYYTGIDEARLQSHFNSSYEAGKSSVIIKASDVGTYNAIKAYMIDNQNVFKFLRDGSGTVSYWVDDDMCTITINL